MLAEIMGIENEHLDPATKALIRWKLLEKIEDKVADRLMPSEKARLETELLRRQLERTPPLNDDITERMNPALTAATIRQASATMQKFPSLLGVAHPPEWVKASISAGVPAREILADAKSLYMRTSDVTGAHYASGADAIKYAAKKNADDAAFFGTKALAAARRGLLAAAESPKGVLAQAASVLQTVGKRPHNRIAYALRSVL